MQISHSLKFTALIAASLLALSSVAYAAGEAGKDSKDKSGTDNACAEGGGDATNANCTTK